MFVLGFLVCIYTSIISRPVGLMKCFFLFVILSFFMSFALLWRPMWAFVCAIWMYTCMRLKTLPEWTKKEKKKILHTRKKLKPFYYCYFYGAVSYTHYKGNKHMSDAHISAVFLFRIDFYLVLITLYVCVCINS